MSLREPLLLPKVQLALDSQEEPMPAEFMAATGVGPVGTAVSPMSHDDAIVGDRLGDRLGDQRVRLGDQRRGDSGPANCEELQEEKLPMYWLFLLGSWVPPQSIFWTLIQTIIVPAQVATIVGDSQKQLALGYVATATNIGGSWGPITGTLSDRCNSRFGRRRPFMFFGPISFCGALLVMMHAHSLDVFAAGNFLFCFTGAIHCSPFNAILPEIVPVAQRSTAGAIQSWTGTIGSQISAALGVLVGQQLISYTTVYYTAMTINCVLIAPLGLLVVQKRPGCCTPEPLPPKDPSVEARKGKKYCARHASAMIHFFDAIRFRPYFWLAIMTAMQTLWGNLQGLFYFYWFEDVISPHFDIDIPGLPTYHLSNSSQTALAVNQAIGTVGSFVFALPGGWLGDHMEPRTVLVITGYLTCAFPLINALLPTYTWVLLCTAIGGVTSGIAGGSANRFAAECMPCDEFGKTMNAGRDVMLLGTVSQLTSAIIPPILGHAFGWFSEREVAYRTFFLVAAGVHAISVTLYFLIDPAKEHKRVREAAATAATAAAGASTTTKSTDAISADATVTPRKARAWSYRLWGASIVALGVCGLVLFGVGAGCIHGAVGCNATRVGHGCTIADERVISVCGDVSHVVLPDRQRSWHHGMLLGLGLIGLSVCVLVCFIGCCSIRRTRRRHMLDARNAGLQQQTAGFEEINEEGKSSARTRIALARRPSLTWAAGNGTGVLFF